MKRFVASSAFFALLLLVPLPYVVVQELWHSDLTDRITCAVTVALLISFGVGLLIHAFRGKPFIEIGE